MNKFHIEFHFKHLWIKSLKSISFEKTCGCADFRSFLLRTTLYSQLALGALVVIPVPQAVAQAPLHGGDGGLGGWDLSYHFEGAGGGVEQVGGNAKGSVLGRSGTPTMNPGGGGGGAGGAAGGKGLQWQGLPNQGKGGDGGAGGAHGYILDAAGTTYSNSTSLAGSDGMRGEDGAAGTGPGDLFGGSGGGGGAGGFGLVVDQAGSVVNDVGVTIAGGAGGAGGNGADELINEPFSGTGGNGGAGGIGIYVRDPDLSITNNGIIRGGEGGAAGAAGKSPAVYGQPLLAPNIGGDPGAGSSAIAIDTTGASPANSTRSLINGATGEIYGGRGGASASVAGSVTSIIHVDGADGGDGVLLDGGIVNQGIIQGGDGSAAGVGPDATLTDGGTGLPLVFQGANGGSGGDGIDSYNWDSTKTTINSGTVKGGQGGAGGDVAAPSATNSGNGGNGGGGLIIRNAGKPGTQTLINTGTIIGGDGGAGGHVANTDQTNGSGGNGGNGLYIVGNLINSGTIRAGTGGAAGSGMAGKDGYAVVMWGDGSILEIRSGSNIVGTVVANAKNNVFALGGDQDATFSGTLSTTFDHASDYQGFKIFRKSGASTWTLAASYNNDWQIRGGTLEVGDKGAIADTSTIDTGLANDKGYLAFNRSDTVTFGGTITGTGGFKQRGAGVVTLTGSNDYTGDTVVANGTLSVASEGAIGTGGLVLSGGYLQITGTDYTATGKSVTISSQKTGFDIADSSNSFTVSQDISGSGELTKKGAGTLVLTGTKSYTGGTVIEAGDLWLGDGTTDGSIAGDISIASQSKLYVKNTSAYTLGSDISGDGGIVQDGSAVLTLTGNNKYKGGTLLNSGTVSVQQEENLGDAAGDLNFSGGTLQITGTDFNGTDRTINWGAQGGQFDIADAGNSFTLANEFTGSGGLTKSGKGTLVLTGDSSSFAGLTNINAGSLRMHGGSLGDGTGTVNVAKDASLGGYGTIGGTTNVASGGTLFGRSGQVLNFSGDLTLNAGSNVDVTLNGGPSNNEIFHVDGGLTVDGTLTINPNSNVDVGVYRIFQSDNGLTDNGMSLAPGSDPDYGLQVVQQSGQINLVNSGSRSMSYWDGTTLVGDGTVHGGDGTWDGNTSNWTHMDGTNNFQWPDGQFAIFQGTGGTVQVATGFQPNVSGMQFFVDGYTIKDGSITLGSADNRIIVGDGTAQSASYVATIASVLDGANGFTKSGYGTLKLTGNNTYSGTTTVQEGTLELSGNGALNAGSEIALVGTQFDHGRLLINKDQDSQLANRVSGVGDVTKDGIGVVTFTGDNTFSGGLTVKAGAVKAGIANNAFGSGNVSIMGDATLDLASFNETVGNLIGDKSGDGNIDLGSGTLTLNQNLHGDFSGVITGSGGISKNGDGDLVFYGQNNYSGTTMVNQGALVQGAAGGLSANSVYNVADGAQIELGGFTTDMAGLSNGGDVIFGGTGGTVLNVLGDYAGNGGTLQMSAVLGDDNSLTDRMNVSGNTTGNSRIAITNRRGFGGQTGNGIEIISVAGNSDGTFTLNGDYTTKDGKQAIMTDSAYAYTLQKGGADTQNDGNWYLVSQNEKSSSAPDSDCNSTNSCPTPPSGRYSAAAPVYESYTATLQALNKLPTLQQRVGERYLGRNHQTELGETESKAIWGRIEGAHNRQENSSTAGDLHQDINTFIMQAGVDGQFYEDENGKLIAGITGQYGNAHSNIDNRTGDGSGTINTQGWGLGATATWYGSSGFYLDAQAQANWYDSDLGVDAVNSTLKNGNKGVGYAMSVEAGRRFAIDPNWSITPQAQLMWSSVDFDSFNDAYGARISNRDGDSLSARLGLAANYTNSFTGSDGRMVNTSVYGIANLYQELMGDARLNYAGTHMATDSDGTWGGIGTGGTYSWADNKYTIYGEGSINTSLNHFADSYNIKGNVGFRVRW